MSLVQYIIWLLYFNCLISDIDSAMIIIGLFLLSVISFCNSAVELNEKIIIEKNTLGFYFLIKILYFFINTYIIREYQLFIGSYLILVFACMELILTTLPTDNNNDWMYHIKKTKTNYKNLLLVGLIFFVELIYVDLIKIVYVTLISIFQKINLETTEVNKNKVILLNFIVVILLTTSNIDIIFIAYMLMSIYTVKIIE